MPLTDLPDNPFDANAECRFCDEQAGHAADCPWLEGIVAERQAYRRNQPMHGPEECPEAALREELVKANEKVEAFRESATDFASKLQFVIDWADAKGLLAEHVFTFPDGDSWEAKR